MHDLLDGIFIPKMYKVKQEFKDDSLTETEVIECLRSGLEALPENGRIKPGQRICITAGSRGIDNYAVVLKTLAGWCRSRGAEPFIIPAMGSHGGATAEGQRGVLAELGITEESMGCPILASMETVPVGMTSRGREVRIDRFAAQADGIIVCNRIKPHNCFEGTYESGLMKMMAIGLGKQAGASVCHDEGFGRMAENIPAFGRVILANAPVVFAAATIENAFDRTCGVAVIDREDIVKREPELLDKARKRMPELLLGNEDVLIVDTIGKNFSGGGMDPNVTGAFVLPYRTGRRPAQRIAVLDLSPESHGNGNGAGMAHACTRRYFEKIDFEQTYPNALTSRVVENSRIPCVMENDRAAVQFCLQTCVNIDRKAPRMLRIHNTLALGEIWASEAFLPEIESEPRLSIISGPDEMDFDADGNLRDF